MQFLKKSIFTLAALLAVSACQTSGRTYAQMDQQNAFPAIENGKGRVVLYRYSTVGATLHPSVKIDDNVAGTSVPDGFFFVDLSPGQHRVSTKTEATKTLDILLNQKETIYVRQEPAIGWLVGRIELVKVDEAEAKKQLADLHYENDPLEKKNQDMNNQDMNNQGK